VNQGFSNIENSTEKLCDWLNTYGFEGYDPYDIRDNQCIIRLTRIGNSNKCFAILREIVFEFFYSFPSASRRIFRVNPAINAKAMGLFASAYLDLYSVFGKETYREKASECLSWLRYNKVDVNDGIGWGYPFNWQSKKYIPAGTPNGIVTTAAGEAFWKHYQRSGDKESLDYCIKICKFLMNLPVDRINDKKICFSYTPLFINHIHNLNLFVAEFLIKTGAETGNKDWIATGNKAVNYTISDQLDNGAFEYSGPPEKSVSHTDNYHTGFVLRMLHSIWKLTGRDDVFDALNACYRHYISHFFEDRRIPRLTPDKKYRIDIHSCAESANCLSELSTSFTEGLEFAENILNWTIENLQDKSGYFYYGILKSRFTGFPFTSKIPYIRWGEAWMLKALSNFLYNQRKLKA
jgi:hypothetical protein